MTPSVRIAGCGCGFGSMRTGPSRTVHTDSSSHAILSASDPREFHMCSARLFCTVPQNSVFISRDTCRSTTPDPADSPPSGAVTV